MSVFVQYFGLKKYVANIMAAHNNTTPDWDMLPFIDARKIVRKLGLKSKREWNEWAKTKRPTNIPSDPGRSLEKTGNNARLLLFRLAGKK